ncbi:MAG: hypothetical protein JWO06_2372 [Bacteroidota bacterium]|nr:hypothetical protein [Bacteroidota bacterium]
MDILFKELNHKSGLPKLKRGVTKALASHYRGIERGKREGKYFSLPYATLAGEDMSHFQRPPLSFFDMLQVVDTSLIRITNNFLTTVSSEKTPKHCCKKSVRQLFDDAILHLNNTSKYALFHTLALELMKLSAQSRVDGDSTNFQLCFEQALLLNSTADHFLEDAFAAGHMVVQRDKNGLDNKGTHDLYNRLGLKVSNDNGEHWTTYGDDFYEDSTYKMAIEGNLASLNDLLTYFKRYTAEYEQKKPHRVTMYNSMLNLNIPQKQWADTILKTFTAYRYMPHPLDSATYKNVIELKRGSRNGGFYEAGVSTGIVPYHAFQNVILSGTVGIGFNALTPSRGSRFLKRPFSRKIESIIWAGVSADYSYFRYGNNETPKTTEHRVGGAGHVVFLDFITIDETAGYAFANPHGRFMINSAFGFEYKSFKFRLAPSLKYFAEYQCGKGWMHGIRLALRFY